MSTDAIVICGFRSRFPRGHSVAPFSSRGAPAEVVIEPTLQPSSHHVGSKSAALAFSLSFSSEMDLLSLLASLATSIFKRDSSLVGSPCFIARLQGLHPQFATFPRSGRTWLFTLVAMRRLLRQIALLIARSLHSVPTFWVIVDDTFFASLLPDCGFPVVGCNLLSNWSLFLPQNIGERSFW